MAIKSILAPITGYEETNAALVSGLRFARRLGAFVDALHVRPSPQEAVPMAVGGWAGPIAAPVMELAAKEIAERAHKAERLYEEACRKARVSTSGSKAAARFLSLTGRGPDLVPVRARVADLILMGRVPEAGEPEWRLTLEAALMGSGRPLLLLPAETRDPVGQVVAIAWNGSMEAARAAGAALPILAKARGVLLLAGEKDVAIEPSLLDLADWLDRHRISAEIRHVDLKGWPVGEQLVEEAGKAGADFLVMGAYGRSRMRETIFGGATRSVLNESALPVLMAH